MGRRMAHGVAKPGRNCSFDLMLGTSGLRLASSGIEDIGMSFKNIAQRYCIVSESEESEDGYGVNGWRGEDVCIVWDR